MKKSLNIVKVGGQVVEDDASLNTLLGSFCSIQGNKILVTGGGRTATKIASDMGIESLMVNGRRITDEPMLKIVTMVYAGLVNKNVVAELQAKGVNAVGLCGADLNIIRSAKRPEGVISYGFVGDVKEVNTKALKMLIDSGAVPVLCPITHDGLGQLLNTNADTIRWPRRWRWSTTSPLPSALRRTACCWIRTTHPASSAKCARRTTSATLRRT